MLQGDEERRLVSLTGWFNDNIINYLLGIFCRVQNAHIVSTHTWPLLFKKERQAKILFRNFPKHKPFYLIPIHRPGHWACGIIALLNQQKYT